MIDYHAHVAALKVIQDALDEATGGSPHEARWQATKAAIQAEPGCALLGTLLDHLLERSENAQAERDLLEESARLFKAAAGILNMVEPLRMQFEAMVQSPNTATPGQFQAIIDQLQGLVPVLNDLQAQAKDLTIRTLPPFRHVAAHAVAQDQQVAGWLWRDVVLSRRTDAFVRALQSASDGSSATLSFAFGALAGYSANALGSSFIAQVVGGPRRSHPIRDRVARYAVGAWLKINEPSLCYPLINLRDNLTFGNPQAPTLPTAIQTQITTALAVAYPVGAPPLMPKLDEGYATLLRHLELLESFPRLAPVEDIPPVLLTRIMQSTDASKTLFKPTSWDWGNDPTDPRRFDEPPSPVPGNNQTQGACNIIGLIILITTIIGLFIYREAAGRWPWESEAQAQPPPSSSQAALTTFVESDSALVMVSFFYHLHNALYVSVSTGVTELKRIGVLYPDELDLPEPMFKQFTRLMTSGQDTAHPRRPLPDPDVNYGVFPRTQIEEPGTFPSPYPEGATPSAFLRKGLEASVSNQGVKLWLRHQDSPSSEDDINLNLDADRGFEHPCWRIAAGRSITENPVSVEVLDYRDVE